MEYKVTLTLPVQQTNITLSIPGVNQKTLTGIKIQEQPSIPIEALTQDQAEEYAERLKQQFLTTYKSRKDNPPMTQFERGLANLNLSK